MGRSDTEFRSVLRAHFWLSNRLATLWGVFFVFGEAATIANPGKGGVGLQAFAAVLLPAGVWLAYRGSVCATVIVTTEGLTSRTVMRDRTWPWDTVEHAELVTAPNGALAYTRLMLAVHLVDGRTVRLNDVNFSPRSKHGQAALALAADQINHFAGGGTRIQLP